MTCDNFRLIKSGDKVSPRLDRFHDCCLKCLGVVIATNNSFDTKILKLSDLGRWNSARQARPSMNSQLTRRVRNGNSRVSPQSSYDPCVSNFAPIHFSQDQIEHSARLKGTADLKVFKLEGD